MPRRYNIHAVPTGRVQANRNDLSTATTTKQQRDRARQRSFTSTCALRHKLLNVKVVQHDSSWVHMKGDKIIATFANVGDAVAAL